MYDVNKLPLKDLKVTDFRKIDGEFTEVEVQAPYFIRNGELFVSCEHSEFVADYYQEFGIEFSPGIEKWAKDNGGYWEWVNPGCIVFCK